MLYTIGKLSAPESQKPSHFLDQNKLDTLQLVAVASEDKIKILSCRYLVLHSDVIRDTINCQKESFHQFF